MRIWLVLLFAPAVFAEESGSSTNIQSWAALKNTTILIIRHAEKPESGFDLAPAGNLRARAYIQYFSKLQMDGRSLTPDYLFSTADSNGSHRPRLTLEPLSQAMKIKIDSQFKNKNVAGLIAEIRSHPHGENLLICWHHGEIPALLQALDISPDSLLPQGKWPDDVFGWMIELQYDAAGKLHETQLIHENLMPDDIGDGSSAK